jgi:hypothetical protein
MTYPGLLVSIVALRDLDWFPGIAECEFMDAVGQLHRFVEKIPIVSENWLIDTTVLPYLGVVRCKILAEWSDTDGRELVRVSTEEPDYVDSTEGLNVFVVLSSQLKRNDA